MSNEAEGSRSLEQAVRLLQEKLLEASHLEGRLGAIEAQLAVAEFLSLVSAPGELELQQPINSLISALALISLDDGHVAPLLQPAKVSGSHRNSIDKESAKGAAAFVVRRLCDAGMGVDDACDKLPLFAAKRGSGVGRGPETKGPE